MPARLEGRARRFGDNINSDYIITSARKKETLDGAVLRQYLLETVDPAFAASVEPGDLIVAGRNFGCGSAMEVAVTVIQAAGIRAVIAESFSRSFYRNAINNGLLVIECDTREIAEGHRVIVDLGAAAPVVRNETAGFTLTARPMPAIMQEVLAAGGLVPYVRRLKRPS
jgi:3-isopropylmalate/(R)-2-methylmalate dehydratase small subunit